MRPGNESRRYDVTTSLIGWAHTYTDPDMTGIKCVTELPQFILHLKLRNFNAKRDTE